VGDGEGTDAEKEGGRHPPHLGSPPNFSVAVAPVNTRRFVRKLSSMYRYFDAVGWAAGKASGL